MIPSSLFIFATALWGGLAVTFPV